MRQLIRELLAEKLETRAPEGAEMLTSREVARYLRVSKDALMEWRKNDVGPAFLRLHSGKIRYPVSGFKRYLRQHLHGGILATKNIPARKAKGAQ